MKPKTRGTQKSKKNNSTSLPVIPDKCYFTISEVAFLCHLKPYVLRYWEEEFPQLKPLKRRGNRRYYQHHDVLMIRQIKKLLYEDGFTIDGARAQLKSNIIFANKSAQTEKEVKKLIAELEGILQELTSQENF